MVINKKQRIIEHLKETWDPVAIVLTGSQASGNIASSSDWDFYVFTDREFVFGLENFEGEVLDVSIEKYPLDDDFIFDTKHHPEQFLEIVSDNSYGQIEKAVKRTEEKYQNGPPDISDNEYQRLKKVLNRYIHKVEGRKHIPGISFYYLGIFYEIALRLWFQLQNKWPLSPHEALPYIKKNDPVFYNLLEKIFNSLNVDEQLRASKEIYAILFDR